MDIYLLLGANIPIHYLGDAILIACFLINKMSSFSLENKVLYSILFPKEPALSYCCTYFWLHMLCS